MSINAMQTPPLRKAFTMALFGDNWQNYLKDAEATIKSICEQNTQDFIVDIAVDRPEARAALTALFQKCSAEYSKPGEEITPENNRLIFTDLPEGVDNKKAAAIRFGKYMLDKDSPIRILFAADLDDIFPPDYNDKMTATIDGGASIAIANQVSFPIGTYWREGTSIQVPRFERGHEFDLPQILDFNFAGFCNTAIDLKSEVFQLFAPTILSAIENGTNKQPDRNGYGVAIAYGAKAVLSEADFGYGQGNGFYGQNGTSLISELNMQYIFTDQLVGLDGLPLEARQIIHDRHQIDSELRAIYQESGILWQTYEMLVAEGKATRQEAGYRDLWGEQVLARTRQEVKAATPYFYEFQRQLG